MLKLVFATAFVAVVALPEKCNIDLYPSPYPPTQENMTMPTYKINLDLDPMDRWNEVGSVFKVQINHLLNIFLKHSVGTNSTKFGRLIKELLDQDEEHVLSKVPYEYAQEIRGMAKATGIDLGYMMMFQFAYEVEGLCTSIVAQDKNGYIWHGRNLDFGLFSGYNWTEQEGGFPGAWELTEALRPVLFKAEFMKGGNLVFSAVEYAGYIGIHTGMKPGVFALSVDSRFDENFDKYLIEFLHGNYTGQFLTLETRTALTNANSFDEAVQMMSSYKSVGPAYIILSGILPRQGAVVTREGGTNTPVDVWTLDQQFGNGSYYLLETNYDHWVKPPIFDDREDSAFDCLDRQIGAQNFNGFQDLYKVLSAGPNLNRLTTFTWLASAKNGVSQAWKRWCKGIHGGTGTPGSGTWKWGCAIW